MKIILLGPPGSGKSTQAKIISKKYNIANISASKILIKETKNKTILGKEIKFLINSGNLVDDKIIISLIKNKILNLKENKFLLDGFPRTIEQAYSLNDINIDYIIEFKISNKLILERISGRSIHLKSNRVYHDIYNPSKIKGIDDFTGEKLIRRNDDKKEIIIKRLNDYYDKILPVSNFYKEQSYLGKVKYFNVECDNNSIDDISIILKKIL